MAIRRPHNALWLGAPAAAALLAAPPAHALTCDEVVEMLAGGFETDIVVSAMQAEGSPVTGGGAACLEQQGAAAAVVDAARGLEAAAAQAPDAAPVLTKATSASVSNDAPVQALDLQETAEAAEPAPLAAVAAPVPVEPVQPAPAAKPNRRRLGIGIGLAAGGLTLLGTSSALRGGIQSDLEAQALTPDDAAGRIGVHNLLVYTGYGLVVGGAATAGTSFLSPAGAALTWRTAW